MIQSVHFDKTKLVINLKYQYHRTVSEITKKYRCGTWCFGRSVARPSSTVVTLVTRKDRFPVTDITTKWKGWVKSSTNELVAMIYIFFYFQKTGVKMFCSAWKLLWSTLTTATFAKGQGGKFSSSTVCVVTYRWQHTWKKTGKASTKRSCPVDQRTRPMVRALLNLLVLLQNKQDWISHTSSLQVQRTSLSLLWRMWRGRTRRSVRFAASSQRITTRILFSGWGSGPPLNQSSSQTLTDCVLSVTSTEPSTEGPASVPIFLLGFHLLFFPLV